MRQGFMQVHSYIRLTWYDEFFTWDPDDYGGLRIVTLNSDVIWTPTLVIYNRCVTVE